MAEEKERAKIRGKATKGHWDERITKDDLKKANARFKAEHAKDFPLLDALLDAETDE